MLPEKLRNHLDTNLVQGFRTSPFQAPLKAWALVLRIPDQGCH